MAYEHIAQSDLEDVVKEEEVIQLVGFKLGDEEYAIDILKIQEIIRMVEITTVPRVDHFVLGVMNLRGKVIPVVDLRLRFNLEKSDFDKNTRIIVVNFEKESIGFVVDEVTEVMRITKSIVEPTPPLVGSIGQEYILGICKYHERLIILLDIDRVIFGDKHGDSDLKKRFFSQPESESEISDIQDEQHEEQSSEASAESTAQIEEVKATEQSAKEDKEAASAQEELMDAVNEVINGEENPANEQDDVSQIPADDIDALIAAELAKREKETEELLQQKKKKKKVDMDPEEVLEDALKQSDEVLGKEDVHVSQDDLDALIAAELAKREKETEELLKKKKEKKKSVVEENVNKPDESLNDNSEEEENTQGNKKDTIVIERDSLEELKAIAEKIINGEISEIDIDIKGEIGELLKLLVETKRRVDDVEPTVDDSSKRIPVVKNSLDDVNEKAEDAAFNLMENVENMLSVYKEIEDKLGQLESSINSKDKDSALQSVQFVEEKLGELDNMGFEMLNSLEFQDITEQKIQKIIGYTEEIGAKFGAILGYMKAKQMQGEELSVSQEDVDKLLSDFGLN